MSGQEKLLDFANWQVDDLMLKAWEYLQDQPFCSTSNSYINRQMLAAKLVNTTSQAMRNMGSALQSQLSKIAIAEDAEPRDRLREVHHAR